MKELNALNVVGVPYLFGAGYSPDGQRWLVSGPAGALLGVDALSDLVVATVAEVARIIERLAAAGYLHGDISANNIVLLDTGSVLLVDLGCARRIAKASFSSIHPYSCFRSL